MNERFSDYIEVQRKKTKISKTALAEQAGISRQGLYKILNGDVDQIYLSTLVKLAIPLRVHPIMLIRHLLANWEFPSPPIDGALRGGDAVGFVGDVTYPDNSIVMVKQQFRKIWCLQNIGNQTWIGYSLKCFDNDIHIATDRKDLGSPDVFRGLKPVTRTVAIPEVEPGGVVDITVDFTAPDYPCSAVSYWKMVDDNGDICFPELQGLSCLVQVILM